MQADVIWDNLPIHLRRDVVMSNHSIYITPERKTSQMAGNEKARLQRLAEDLEVAWLVHLDEIDRQIF